MRRAAIILTFLLPLLCVGHAQAQRCLPGMTGIELRAGAVDGIHTPVDFYAGAAMMIYNRHADRWVIGIEYLTKHYAYEKAEIPKAQITAEGGYYLTVMSDPAKIFHISIGGSALAGYETSNWNKKLLYDGATLRNKDAFIYGGAVTLELEAYLSDRFILSLHARERCLWGSSIGHFHFQFGAGIKFIIN